MSPLPRVGKEAIISKLLSSKISIPLLAKQEGIGKSTLYTWRNQLQQQGWLMQQPEAISENWSASTKFAVIVESATLNEQK